MTATPLQMLVMNKAKDAPTLASASNHSAFNLANAGGAWTGGMAVTAGWGLDVTGRRGRGPGSRGHGGPAGPYFGRLARGGGRRIRFPVAGADDVARSEAR